MLRIAHTVFLYALLALPVFSCLFVLMRLWKKKAIKSLSDPDLFENLSPGFSPAKQVLKFILVCIAFAFLVIGIADPQVGSRLEEVKRKGIDIIIALDVSNSMQAEDIKPSRLERAKQSISRLVDKLQNDRIGMIVFAGEAYTQLPLTTDYAAAKLFASTIDCNMIPAQGTAIGAAINLAINSFGTGDKKYKALIIITDGENHEDDAAGAARDAASKGIIIHTIGMGSPEGAPIPVLQNNIPAGFRKDPDGNTIITKLDETMLQLIAGTAGGKFVRASNSEDGLEIILKEINKMEKKELGSKVFTDYEDRFQYFLGAALLFLLIEIIISDRKIRWLSGTKLFGEKK